MESTYQSCEGLLMVRIFVEIVIGVLLTPGYQKGKMIREYSILTLTDHDSHL